MPAIDPASTLLAIVEMGFCVGRRPDSGLWHLRTDAGDLLAVRPTLEELYAHARRLAEREG